MRMVAKPACEAVHSYTHCGTSYAVMRLCGVAAGYANSAVGEVIGLKARKLISLVCVTAGSRILGTREGASKLIVRIIVARPIAQMKPTSGMSRD